MPDNLEKLWFELLSHYSRGIYLPLLLKAKKAFFDLTGQINEDDEDFEMRMSSFNDWYLTRFTCEELPSTILKDYLSKNMLIDPFIKDALESIHFSLFRYVKISWRKQIVLKDLISKKSVNLSKNHKPINFVAKEIFSGRTITYQGEIYLLPGLCLFPNEALGPIEKQSKKVRKLNNETETYQFLLSLESLKTKYIRYGHIDPKKIFSFSLQQ